MPMSKIERRRVQLQAYSNAINEIDGRLGFELDYYINSTDEQITDEQWHKAKIRCDVYINIIKALENMALPDGERDY